MTRKDFFDKISSIKPNRSITVKSFSEERKPDVRITRYWKGSECKFDIDGIENGYFDESDLIEIESNVTATEVINYVVNQLCYEFDDDEEN